jgi:hypothetical protein
MAKGKCGTAFHPLLAPLVFSNHGLFYQFEMYSSTKGEFKQTSLKSHEIFVEVATAMG